MKLSYFLPRLVVLALTLCGFPAKAENISDLAEGFELRVPGKTVEIAGEWNQEWVVPTPAGTPGHLQDLRVGLRLGGFQVAPGGLTLKDPRIEIRASRWRYQKPPFLDVECTNIRVDLAPGGLQAPWVNGLSVDWQRSENGPSTALVTGDLESSVDGALRPLFSATALQNSLKLQADCPGNTSEILESSLRAWLADWPAKEASRWAELRTTAANWGREAAGKGLSGVLDRLPRGSARRARLTLLKTPTGYWVLRGGDAQDFLSSAARASLSPRPTDAEIVLSSGFLANAGRLALVGLFGQSIELSQTMRAEDLRAYLPEAASLPPSTGLHFRFDPLGCPTDAKAFRARPWLSASGVDRGIDLFMTPTLEIVDTGSGSLVAKRRFPLELRFRLPRANTPTGGAASFGFAGGRWRSEDTDDGSCALTALPPELGATVDWVLNSELIQNFAHEHLLLPSFQGHGDLWAKLRVLGQANYPNRRAAGGYYGEALVLSVKLP